MQRIGLAGLSYRTASLKALEQFTFAPEELGKRLPALKAHCGFNEVAYLSTCNRIEIVFATDEQLELVEIERRLLSFFAPEATPEAIEAMRRSLYVYRGTEAANHLFRVTSSLDSMVLGETEILRQVKRAYQTGSDLGTVGPLLHLLFNQSLKAAKRVHTETRLTSRPVSMISLATGLIRNHLQHLPAGARVVLVGVGEMTVKAANYLISQGPVSLVFVNRTVDRATALAQRFGGEALSLDEFLKDPGTAEVIVSATSAPGPLFTLEALEPLLDGRTADRRVLLIDLALPRDFDTAFDAHPGVELHDIEALRVVAERNQSARGDQVERAFPIIEHQIRVLRRKVIEARVGPAVVKLQQATVETTALEIERLLSKDLLHLTDQDKAVLRIWAERLGRRVAQLPIGSLKEMAFACECGGSAGTTVLPEHPHEFAAGALQ